MSDCNELKKATGIKLECCQSCHDDYDYDSSAYDFEESEYKGVTYRLCCRLTVALEDLKNDKGEA